MSVKKQYHCSCRIHSEKFAYFSNYYHKVQDVDPFLQLLLNIRNKLAKSSLISVDKVKIPIKDDTGFYFSELKPGIGRYYDENQKDCTLNSIIGFDVKMTVLISTYDFIPVGKTNSDRIVGIKIYIANAKVHKI